MCTIVIIRRPDHAWPVIIGANRDEMVSRPWEAPARHWPDRQNVVAGLDCLAGGTWLARNDEGVVAAVMNREHSLGPLPGKRSRGELPLEAVDHADATAAAEALKELDPDAYQPFNMLIADNQDAYWLCSNGISKKIELNLLPLGWSMLTSKSLNDQKCPRTMAYLSRFERAPVPDPEHNDWISWQMLLASRTHDASDTAMCIATENGFGTVCSTLIALPNNNAVNQKNNLRGIFLFAAGSPDANPFNAIES